MAPQDSDFVGVAAWFETSCKPLDGLLLTLSRIKHIFRKRMPQDTIAALNQAESQASALLQQQDEPDVSGYGLDQSDEDVTPAFHLLVRQMRGDINTLNQSMAVSYMGVGGTGGQSGQGGNHSANSGSSDANVQATIQDLNLETPELDAILAYVHPD
ncbi:hypothetical protein FNYG_14121 [Fusarium nygamai]|uniref:Uncharacterized protein n=1 Tax=Gibberella nygamai TaxID=42673 RepID=A0A2K0UTC5_GIBNY|nr:hypothetical protein FNYG_14121 [Fusarium nygamai]